MKKILILIGVILTVMISTSCKKHFDYFRYEAVVLETNAPFLHKNDTIIFGVDYSRPHQYYVGIPFQMETYKTDFGDLRRSVVYNKQEKPIGEFKVSGEMIKYNSLIKVIKKEGKYYTCDF